MRSFVKQLCAAAISLFLIIAILAPSAIKLSHALNEHQEQLCLDNSSVHVHEIELDCDFQKYQQSPQLYPDFANIGEIPTLFSKEKNENYYTFLNKNQQLPFTLRGPPSAS